MSTCFPLVDFHFAFVTDGQNCGAFVELCQYVGYAESGHSVRLAYTKGLSPSYIFSFHLFE
jgi:hypothetical protein